MSKKKIPGKVKIIVVILGVLLICSGIARYNKGFRSFDKVANFFDDLIPDKPAEETESVSGTDGIIETEANIVEWTEFY